MRMDALFTDFRAASEIAKVRAKAEIMSALLCENHALWAVCEETEESGIYALSFHNSFAGKDDGAKIYFLPHDLLADIASEYETRLKLLPDIQPCAIEMALTANLEALRAPQTESAPNDQPCADVIPLDVYKKAPL